MSDPVLGPGLAAALGALQGVAEFLPISSSGHLAPAEASAPRTLSTSPAGTNVTIFASSVARGSALGISARRSAAVDV